MTNENKKVYIVRVNEKISEEYSNEHTAIRNALSWSRLLGCTVCVIIETEDERIVRHVSAHW